MTDVITFIRIYVGLGEHIRLRHAATLLVGVAEIPSFGILQSFGRGLLLAAG